MEPLSIDVIFYSGKLVGSGKLGFWIIDIDDGHTRIPAGLKLKQVITGITSAFQICCHQTSDFR